MAGGFLKENLLSIFKGIVHAREVNAEAITRYLLQFLSKRDLSLEGD